MNEHTASTARFTLGSGAAIAHGLGVGLLQSLLIFVFGMRFLAPALHVRNPFAPSASSFAFIGALGAMNLFLILWLGLLKAGGLRLRDLGWTRPRRGRDLLLGAVGAAASVALLATTVAVLGGHAGEFIRRAAELEARERLLLLCIGALAAVTEETIFRGYLQSSLHRRWGPVVAVLVTAALFALYHLQLSPVALFIKFGIGLIFGSLRLTTGTLWSPAAAHLLVWVLIGAA